MILTVFKKKIHAIYAQKKDWKETHQNAIIGFSGK